MQEFQDAPPIALPYTQLSRSQRAQRLRELAHVFLKLGTIAFGGPAAHIALMDDEVVQRRQWMSRETLLDLLGVTNLIPGPNSTELAIHIGYERAGWKGLVVAGSCFILPATLIVWALAAVYVQYQTIPQVSWLLYGVKPVMMAIVLQALGKLSQSAIKDLPTGITAAIVIVLTGFGHHEILLLILAGVSVMLAKQAWHHRSLSAWFVPLPEMLMQVGPLVPAAVSPIANRSPAMSWVSVLLFFLKIGCVLYGSGYVLLAFLQKDLVERTHWLTSQQLLDAVAIGQLTPGPVFTTATFIGYLLAGNAGAIAGTIGIFLPAFLLVALVNPWVPKLRQSAWANGFLDGVNAASMALMAVVTWQLGRAALTDGLTITVGLASALLLFRYKLNSAWLVLAGAAIGYLTHSFP